MCSQPASGSLAARQLHLKSALSYTAGQEFNNAAIILVASLAYTYNYMNELTLILSNYLRFCTFALDTLPMSAPAPLVRCVQLAHTPLYVHVPYNDITVVASRGEHIRLLAGHTEDIVLVQALPPVFRDYVVAISVVAVLRETAGPAAHDDTPLHEVDRSHLSSAERERGGGRETGS